MAAAFVFCVTLLESAIDEMLRWISPVNYFTRTATGDADLGGALAIVLAAEAARSAAAASPRSVDQHGIAFRHAGDAGTDLLDPSGILVAERERKPPR